MVMAARTKEPPGAHRSQELRSFYPDDDLLRRAGFRITFRPNKGEPRWERKGQEMTQHAALDMALDEGW
jgi:hypothetical protein